MHDHQDFISYLAFCTGVGAMAQALMYINSREKGKPFSKWEFFWAVALSGFIGFLIALAGDAYGLNTSLSGVLSGLGGFAGKEGVSFAFALVRKRTGVEG